MGADAVELDARQASDGTVVVHHDSSLDGVVFCETLPSEHPPSVPTLAQALDACGPLRVNIELKDLPGEPGHSSDDRLPRAVLDVVAQLDCLDRVWFSSFHEAHMAALVGLEPTAVTGMLCPNDERLDGFVERAVAQGHAAIHPHEALVDEALVTAAHDAGLQVHAWTVNDPDRTTQLAGLGVDGVMTDHPDRAAELLRR